MEQNTTNQKKQQTKTTKKKYESPDNIVELRSFLEEDVQHLFAEKTFLTQCLLSQDAVSLIEKVYFDAEYQKNQVIRVGADEKVEIYQVGKSIGKWRPYIMDKLLDDLVNRVHHILNWHKLKHIKEIGRISDIEGYNFESSLTWLDNLYDNECTRDETKNAIKDILLHKYNVL